MLDLLPPPSVAPTSIKPELVPPACPPPIHGNKAGLSWSLSSPEEHDELAFPPDEPSSLEESPAPGTSNPKDPEFDLVFQQRAGEQEALFQRLLAAAPEALDDEKILFRLAISTSASLAPIDEAMTVLSSLLLSDAASDSARLLKHLEALKKMATISHTLQLRIQVALEGAQTLRLRRNQGRR